MRVWIDQDLCTGDGLCAEIEPAIFFMHDDGLAYVKETTDPLGTIDGEPKNRMHDMVNVPEPHLEGTIEAAEECPGECIFIEAGD